jgi:hypothetical protein
MVLVQLLVGWPIAVLAFRTAVAHRLDVQGVAAAALATRLGAANIAGEHFDQFGFFLNLMHEILRSRFGSHPEKKCFILRVIYVNFC